MSCLRDQPTDERLRDLVADHLRVDKDKVIDDAEFTKLGADSLDVVELVMKIEEEFHIDIPDEVIEDQQWTTVGDARRYLNERLGVTE